MKNLDEAKNQLKSDIFAKTKQIFESTINEACSSKMKEEEEEEGMDDDESEDMDDDESEDKDEPMEEAMKVVATKVPTKGQSRQESEDLTINRYQDLVKLANSGKYEYFMVTKNNGDETEYHVDFNGKTPKLVEM